MELKILEKGINLFLACSLLVFSSKCKELGYLTDFFCMFCGFLWSLFIELTLRYLIILILLGTTHALAATKDSVKKQLQFSEGKYKIYRGDEELCTGTSVDIAYEGDDKHVTVRAGQKFIWGNINTPKFEETDGADCKVSVANTLEKLHLKSVSTYKCKDPKNNLVITQELLAEKDQIRIDYERVETDKKKNQKFYCVFKK